MNNDSRYYTPDVTEFHVGFEFEFHSDKREWKKFVFDLFKPMAVLQNVVDNSEMFRVKYLDEADLVELGWVDSKLGYKNTKAYHIGSTELFFYDKCANNVYITDKSACGIFDGTIRNKSELRKVMAMLGIKKESVVDLDEKYQVN